MMEEKRYILLYHDEIIAKWISLEDAITLISVLIEKYYLAREHEFKLLLDEDDMSLIPKTLKKSIIQEIRNLKQND